MGFRNCLKSPLDRCGLDAAGLIDALHLSSGFVFFRAVCVHDAGAVSADVCVYRDVAVGASVLICVGGVLEATTFIEVLCDDLEVPGSVGLSRILVLCPI